MCRYYAFELCAANLKDWADSTYTGVVPSEFVAINQMACGLAFVHKTNHVHRDICPANILISIGGDRLTISDFGLCKEAHTSGSISVSQNYGQKKWLAPERIERMSDPNNRVTIDCDTWAMGCVFYYFITKGSHPFHVDDWQEMRRKIRRGTFNLESKSSIFVSISWKN